MKFTGSEKQVEFANNLIEKAQKAVNKHSGTKKEKFVRAEMEILPALKDGMDAGKIIDVFNINGNFIYSTFIINKGWDPDATSEKAIEYLNS